MEKKPSWLRKGIVGSPNRQIVEGLLKELSLNTVCSEARCPNYDECFSRKTATFMILGAVCTRRCRFCAVGSASDAGPKAAMGAALKAASESAPESAPESVSESVSESAPESASESASESVSEAALGDLGHGCGAGAGLGVRAPDPGEPERVALAVKRLGLRYAVITSVTRDDMADGGAAHFANTIRAIRALSPETAVEALIPDFQGDAGSLAAVADAAPSVISHNMETVAQLYGTVRPQADYSRSLRVLREIRRLNPDVRSKTGFMLGLGETAGQVGALLDDLIEVRCEILTIGQYLAPSNAHLPVREYVHPDIFDEYARLAREKGFAYVSSAPFVRSSYNAAEALAAPVGGARQSAPQRG
jgi:lipoic acid synthetase